MHKVRNVKDFLIVFCSFLWRFRATRFVSQREALPEGAERHHGDSVHTR